MVLDESAITLPPDSTGSSIRTVSLQTVDRDGTVRSVQLQGVIVTDPHGFPNPELVLWQEVLHELRDMNNKLTLIAAALE